MTEEEKAKERAIKADAVARLAAIARNIGRYRYALDDTDQRLRLYVDTVNNAPERHNLYEILGILRFFYLLDKYTWKPKRVQRFFKFYESLRFNGLKGRMKYRLTPVQCFQFANIFGFADATGKRLIRDAYIFVPRKFSKTTSAASLAVYDMLFGDHNAQAYVGANSYDQAKICFDEIRNIMRDLDPTGRHFKVNREKITFRTRERDSFIQCLTANARTKDGLNASTVIMDEYAQARNTAGKNGADLKNTLTSSMGVREQPLTVVITTASEVVDGPMAHELDGVKKVLKGEVENDTVFGALYMPDCDDAEDDPETWAKVQPHLGITVQANYYEKEWQRAQLSAENMLAFRTKLLNIFAVNDSVAWLPEKIVRRMAQRFRIDEVQGYPECAVAFDLSVHDDLSAVTYTVYDGGVRKFFSYTDYYFPEGALATHANRELYTLWHEQGFLHFCHGDRIDVRMIAEDIIRRSKVVRIIRIGYDAYKAKELVNILSATGGREQLMPFSQTNGNFNLAVESLEMMAYADDPLIVIDDNPINIFCFLNCIIDEDRLENKKPMKIAHNRKIDGAITTLMTIGLLYSYER